jgi:hypothetical protein
MRANAINLRRAGLLLRAMSAKVSWSHGPLVNARDVAKGELTLAAATDRELAEVLAYMVDQGWLLVEAGADATGSFALTRHGLDEAQRKMPAEPKPHGAERSN